MTQVEQPAGEIERVVTNPGQLTWMAKNKA
jgi:hypothetical protein